MRRIGILAGELSGDALGGPLMAALRQRFPDAIFEGVGGPRMAAEGLESLYPMERLSVMGLAEVLRHLPELLRMRAVLARHFLANPPDCFVGIDAPDFNLGLERRLRQGGIPTVHYVSPSVWAWREGRMKGIARSVDLMLTLFPFETDVYQRHGVAVEWVGHPTADRLPLVVDHGGHRRRLGVDEGATLCALLPGSRRGEVERLGPVYAGAVARLAARHPGLSFVGAMASAPLADLFSQQLAAAGVADRVRLVEGAAEDVLGACDLALIASGTATLEALLLKAPMVVAYRMSPLTIWMMKTFNLMKIRRFSLPNLLAGEALVDEYIQEAATPQGLADGLERLLEDDDRRAAMAARFESLHRSLRHDAAASAAAAVADLIGER
ncbi:lipid-A-disaccharide synthase [Ectothiorhodospiraceae bacterium WFHF3C12]|nr:lipid-A-disaccharide synthase [Ectothiorhodospiraceae bacterium WFHF3C12]